MLDQLSLYAYIIKNLYYTDKCATNERMKSSIEWTELIYFKTKIVINVKLMISIGQ